MSNLYKMSDIDILYKVYKHLLEMLSDRKYTLPISIVNTLDEFKDLYKNDITNLEFVVTHENNKISIFWSNIEKLGIPQLKTYIDHMDNENTNHSILILKNSILSEMSSTSTNLLGYLYSRSCTKIFLTQIPRFTLISFST